METLISLVNKIQRACTALGDHGEDNALPTLWEALPSIAVVGGQVPSLIQSILTTNNNFSSSFQRIHPLLSCLYSKLDHSSSSFFHVVILAVV